MKLRRRGDINDVISYDIDSIFYKAREIVAKQMESARSSRVRPDSPIERASRAADSLYKTMSFSGEDYLALLILRTPRAARAQRMMIQRHGGYKNRHARLYELIDFNDTFVDTVLHFPQEDLPFFEYNLWQEMELFCESLRVKNFTEKQYEAITHGLSREIAVFWAARELGYDVQMTSRVQDAQGIDMIISDSRSGRSLGVDIKTSSAFHWRLVKLQARRKMTEQQRMDCQLAGFCRIKNVGHNGIDSILLRINTKHLGEIKNFRFVDQEPIRRLLKNAISNLGERGDQGYIL